MLSYLCGISHSFVFSLFSSNFTLTYFDTYLSVSCIVKCVIKHFRHLYFNINLLRLSSSNYFTSFHIVCDKPHNTDSPLLRQHEQYSSSSKPVIHTRTKHIEVHYHFTRECVKAGDVNLQHISTKLQTSDIFTKTVGANKLHQFVLDLRLTIPDLPSLRGEYKPNTIRTGYQPKRT